MKQDPQRFTEPKRSTAKEAQYRMALEEYFSKSVGSNVEKLQNFAKYVPVQDIRKFVAHTEIFKKILDVHGSIVECGVQFGGRLMAWAALSEIFEPLNHLRNIVGFDTFEGFPDLSEKDKNEISVQSVSGGLAVDSYGDILESISLYDQNRFLPHIKKVRLVRGDARNTIPEYLDKNPHTVIALLHLDFDIYEPTKIALRHFIPRMPKGGIIVFDELNHEAWPGETAAAIEELGINNIRLQRFPYGPTACYYVIE